MTTGQDIIAGALRLISSVTPGETIPGDEINNGLIVLNQMLAAWSTENLMIPFTVVDTFPLVVGKESYTIGQSGSPDISTVRPDEIVYAWLTDTVSGIDYPINFYTDAQYRDIPLKNIQSIPRWLYFNEQYPNSVIYIFPTSSATTYSLNVESKKPIMQFATVNTVMNLPGEYFKAMRYLLADELAPEYGFNIQPGTKLDDNIKEARKMIKRKNTKNTVATFDAALNSRPFFSILTGYIS